MSQRASTDTEPLSRPPEEGEPQPIRVPDALISMLHACTAEQLQLVPAVVAQIQAQRTAALTATGLDVVILAALAEIDRADQSGGIIALDKLRRQLPAVPRSALDAALTGMENRGAISLKVAQSVRSSRAPDGIQSERGLLFFIVLP